MELWTSCSCGDCLKIETSRHKAIMECPHCGVQGVKRMVRPREVPERPLDAAKGILVGLVGAGLVWGFLWLLFVPKG